MEQLEESKTRSPSELRFDPIQHRFWVGDIEYPSVTRILRTVGLMDFNAPWFNERSRRLGEVLHACCALLDEDDLDWSSVPSVLLPEVKGYAEWSHLTGFKPKLIETPLASNNWFFAGIPDVFGEMKNGIAVIDRKRGSAGKATKWQVAGYALLLSEYLHMPATAIRRFVLHSLWEGKPKLVEYRSIYDLNQFRSMVAVFNAGFNEGIFTLGGQNGNRIA